MFNLDTLSATLAHTIYAGKLHFSPITDSTNTDALAAARAGAPHGSVFFADGQRAGRGRGGHAWQSPAAEGLYVSVLLRADRAAAQLSLLPLAAGLAAAAAIHHAAGLTIDIRWPNDLLIGPRKTGGILVEGKVQSGVEGKTEAAAAAYAVVGIGINVHQRAFASGLSTTPTSLDLEAGRPVSRQAVLIALLQNLASEADALTHDNALSTLTLRLQQASTWISGRSVEVHGPQACTGVTDGLDENGFLRVRTAQGIVTVQTGGLRAAQ